MRIGLEQPVIKIVRFGFGFKIFKSFDAAIVIGRFVMAINRPE